MIKMVALREVILPTKMRLLERCLLLHLLFVWASLTPSCLDVYQGSSSGASAAAEACEASERAALLELRARAGAQWPAATYSRWQEGSSDCCQWQGILCASSSRIVSLKLSTGFSSGSSSSSCGPLPSSLATLRSLETLDMAGTCFSEPLDAPLFFSSSSFPNLTLLNLTSTAFSSLRLQAPPLLKLTNLDFSHNSLIDPSSSAAISGLHLLPNLLRFRFSRNLNYNAFPSNITSLTRLLVLDLSSNGIQDTGLPRGLPPSLQYLNLHDNALQGLIPSSELGDLHHLAYLDLSSNRFEGPLLLQIFASLPHLKHLDLSSTGNVWIDAPSSHPCNKPDGQNFEFLGLSSVQLPSLTAPLCFESFLNPNLKFLDLSYTGLNSSWEATYRPLLAKALNLEHLSIAGAAGNFPPWLNYFRHLRSLDISHCSLTGSIPAQLGELNSLRTLDASSNSLTGPIPSAVISNLSSLESLKLAQNSLMGQIPIAIGNLSSLQWLDLSNNHLIGPIPKTLGLLQHHLDGVLLSFNSLSGALPVAIGNIAKLDASNNHISGPLPDIIGNWSRIRYCELYGNNVMGSIPHSIGNWTQLWHLSMGHNHLSGCIPDSISQLIQLSIVPEKDMVGGPVGDFYDYAVAYGLYLGSNFLTCSIPKNIGSLSNLIYLDVSYNNLTGTLPPHLVNLTSLLNLKLAHNLFRGRAPSPLTVYNELDLSANVFEGPMPSILVPPHQTGAHHVGLADVAQVVINLSYNKLIGPIHLEQLCTNLTDRSISLSFSSNELTGSIPSCLSNLSVTSLDVSGNALSGTLPPLPLSVLSLIDVSRNLLTGSLPSFKDTESSSLVVLDLSNNYLSGSLASARALNGSQFLQVLKGGSNSFDEEGIPEWIGSFVALRTLSLHNNRFKGEIPSSLSKCSSLILLDLSHNRLAGRIPPWISNHTFQTLQVLSLRSNKLQGPISDALITWPFLQILDLASNELSGSIPTNMHLLSAMTQLKTTPMIDPSSDNSQFNDIIITFKHMEFQTKVLPTYKILDLSGNRLHDGIPPQVGDLKGLLSLNLSHNMLSGTIPTNLQELSKMESLDLSNNLLVGPIPKDLLSLASLEVIDLSHNRLQGRIPRASHPFNASSFQDNPYLCGVPLPKPCPNNI